MKNKGFTLIEVLITVLIIGILAAISVTQYKKAVMRSKAAQMQTLLNAVVKESDLYYLQNGTYPKSFDDLNIGITLPTLNTRTCLRDLGGASIKQSGDFVIAIHSGNDTTLQSINIIAAYFITGKYKCRGFTRVQQWRTSPHDDGIYCMEAYPSLNCGTNCEQGIFCKDIMGNKRSKTIAGGQITEYY